MSEDGAYMELLAAQEFLLKLSTAGIVAASEAADAKLCLALEHTCVRDNGLHRWIQVVEEVTSGKVSPPGDRHYEHSATKFNHARRDLSRAYTEKVTVGDWRFDLAQNMNRLRQDLSLSFNAVGSKPSLMYWVSNFHIFRNQARAHGLPDVHQRLGALETLRVMQDALIAHMPQFSWPLFYVMPTYPGRATVRPLSDNCPSRLSVDGVDEGVHVLIGSEIVPMRLLTTDRSCEKFFLPNGQFEEAARQGAAQREATYQALSYAPDLRVRAHAARWTGPRPVLDDSVTAGQGRLAADHNLPPVPKHYVSRGTLERELSGRLNNDRDRVVTLMGRGGIGKTTLALHVLHNFVDQDRFAHRIWLSARDVDLEDDFKFDRPKKVRKQVSSIEDVTIEFARLVAGPDVARADAPGVMASYVGEKDTMVPLLVVFDNFETVDDPLALYTWIEETFRAPNKALITTRVEDFKGDWKIDVRGMEQDEFVQLVRETALRSHINDRVSDIDVQDLYRETGGHPYVARVILAEAARSGKRLRQPRTLMATKDEILDALFGAIYEELDDDARRVFLVAALMRSVLPRWQLEALLLRPGNDIRMDVTGAIERLCKVSLMEVVRAGGAHDRSDGDFLHTPMAASAFADKIWKKGTFDFDMREAIEDDLKAGHQFRPVLGLEQVSRGFGVPFQRFARTLAGDVQERGGITPDEAAILDYLCQHWPAGWPTAAELYLSLGERQRGMAALSSYLDAYPDDWVRWKELARLHRDAGSYATQGRTLLSAAFAATRPRDQRLRLLEASTIWLELVERKVYEPSRVKSMGRQFVNGLDIHNVDYLGGDRAQIVRLLLAAQRREDAKRYLRQSVVAYPTNTELASLRREIF